MPYHTGAFRNIACMCCHKNLEIRLDKRGFNNKKIKVSDCCRGTVYLSSSRKLATRINV